MVGVISGQNTDDTALAIMEDTLWWRAVIIGNAILPYRSSHHRLRKDLHVTDDIAKVAEGAQDGILEFLLQ